jgi:hypothetical protein
MASHHTISTGRAAECSAVCIGEFELGCLTVILITRPHARRPVSPQQIHLERAGHTQKSLRFPRLLLLPP